MLTSKNRRRLVDGLPIAQHFKLFCVAFNLKIILTFSPLMVPKHARFMNFVQKQSVELSNRANAHVMIMKLNAP